MKKKLLSMILSILIIILSLPTNLQSVFANEANINSMTLQGNSFYLSEDDARNFMCFLYNCNLTADEVAGNNYYKLLTGKLEDSSHKDIVALALLITTESLIGKYVNEAQYRINFIYNDLQAYCEKQLAGMPDISEEVINDVLNPICNNLKDEIIGGLTYFAYSKTGIVVTQEVYDNLELAISSYNQITGVAGKIQKFIEYTIIGVELALLAYNQEIAARYSYFSAYLSNKKAGYEDEIMDIIMNYILFAIQNNYPIANIDWYPGPAEPWIKHVDEIERWANLICVLNNNYRSDNNDNSSNPNSPSTPEPQNTIILTENIHIQDTYELSNTTLDLNGYTFVVDGNFNQLSGNVNIKNGIMIVNGSYIQSGGLLNTGNGFVQINGNYRAENDYGDGSCNLVMQDENAYVLVKGDFYVAIDRDSNGLLTAGTLELKGDFTQRGDRRGWSYYTDLRTVYGFCPTDKHRVIFSGDTQQNISRQTWQTYNGTEHLNYPVCSYFNIVKSTNPNVVFTKDFFVENVEKGSVFKTLRIKNVNLSNTEFQVNGTFYATDTMIVDSTITTQTLNVSLGTTTLENSELKVIGNADHKGGNLTVKTGKLLVNGNYNHTGGELNAGKGYTEIKGNYSATGSCNLVMQDELGYVLLYGDYYVEKDNDSTGYLTAGTLELKGNFSQYGGKRGIGYLGNPASAYGFCGSDKHIVILSGEEKQTIYTQSTGLFGSLYHYPACSYFNILKIKNTSTDGIDFTSTVYVLEDIEQPTGTNISNKASVYLNNKSAFVDYGELNPTINAYVLNAADVIPTYMDYEEYMATQILSIELENIKMDQNKIIGNTLLNNQKTDFENILCIIAAYDNNELINCTIIPLSIKHKETKDINFSLNITKKATDVKAFVWTDLETMMPLCGSISRTIQ